MSHKVTNWRQRYKWLWAKTEGHCAYCGVKFETYAEMTDDHVIPRSRGGRHDKINRVPCCRSCNSVKGPRSIEYLRDSLQRRRHGRPAFSADQLAYLAASAFVFPAEPRYEFYLEKLGHAFDEVGHG